MKIVQYSNLKTINIDSEIFSQETSPARSKLPLQLLKSIAQRKRNNKRNSNSRGDRYTLNLLKAKAIEGNEQLKSESSVNDFHQPVKAIEIFTSKAHNKTNPQINKGRGFNFTQTCLLQNFQNFDSKNGQERSFFNLRETRQHLKNKFIQRKQKLGEQQFQYQCLKENDKKINPYTQQQYSYITHKERDQLCQIKKATRFRRMSSITKSYKVVTIQLLPAEHHRRPSIQYSPVKMFSPTKTLSNSKKTTAKRLSDIISPQPWQWGLQEGKDFLQ